MTRERRGESIHHYLIFGSLYGGVPNPIKVRRKKKLSEFLIQSWGTLSSSKTPQNTQSGQVELDGWKFHILLFSPPPPLWGEVYFEIFMSSQKLDELLSIQIFSENYDVLCSTMTPSEFSTALTCY